MEYTQYLSLALLCLLGAASPGPSLAVVVRYSVAGNVRQGLLVAVAHGVGVGLYALLTVLGLALLLQQWPGLLLALQLVGALYLLYLGVNIAAGLWRQHEAEAASADSPDVDQHYSDWQCICAGLLTSLVNPKLLLFFSALFSQFVSVDSSALEKTVLVLIPLLVDALWYCLMVVVARALSSSFDGRAPSAWLRWGQGVFALLLLGLGLRLLLSLAWG